MPEKTPPTYKWTVSLADGSPGSVVDAAYPVLDGDGHMLLKDSDHKIVFAAAPGTGCTFTRGALATPAADPISVTKFPDGCRCTYQGISTLPLSRWVRYPSPDCTADHAETGAAKGM